MKIRIWFLVIAFYVLLFQALNISAQQPEKTSENTPFLKKFLEQNPAADANKDGILTLAEGQKWRKSQKGKQPQQRKSRGKKMDPTHPGVKYGKHERHKLDFWQAKSEQATPLFIYIHGGGFRGGNKGSRPEELLQLCLKSGISFASIHYRLSSHAPYPAQMHDSARAVQFLRSKAKEWNLDPKRVAAGGGSAGSGISQWLGFHDDLADPKSKDPIAQQSTRLSSVLALNMQCSYDPREIKKIVPGDAYKHIALVELFARPKGWDWDTGKIDTELDALLKDASPINHLSKGDCPVYILHYEKANKPGNIHHSNFGKHLKEAMDKLGIENVKHMDTDYTSEQEKFEDMHKFLKKHFSMK